MKKIIAGGLLLISGVILYVEIHVSAALYMSDIRGWNTPPGRFGTALIETGGSTPATLALFLGVAGVVFILWGCLAEPVSQWVAFLFRPPEKEEFEEHRRPD